MQAVAFYADNEPIGNVDIILRGSHSSTIEAADLTPFELARQLFLRTQRLGPAAEATDPNPSRRSVFFAALGATATLWAESDDAGVSTHIEAATPGPHELDLSASFTLAVTVEGDLAGAPLRLSVHDLDGSEIDRTYQLDATGHLVAKVPLSFADTYRATLMGQGIAVDSQQFPSPEHQGHVELTFQAKPGILIPVHAIDTNGEPIPGAQFGIVWADDQGSWTYARNLVRTDQQGRAKLTSARPGDFWLLDAHPDFLSTTHGPFNVANLVKAEPQQGGPPSFEPIQIQMTRLATITGYVLADGQKQTEYHLFAWHAVDRPSYHIQLDEERAPDGRFTFKVPEDDMVVTAWAPGFARSLSVPVTATALQPAEVELELRSSIQGIGQALDQATGRPIPGVEVFPMLTSYGIPIVRLNESVKSNEDGRFTVPNITPGELATVKLFADGYREMSFTAQPSLDPSGTPVANFGSLFLGQSAGIAVTVSGYPSDQLLYACRNFMRDNLQLLTESAGQLAVQLEGAAPGHSAVELFDASGLLVARQRITLSGSGPWQCHFAFDKGATLHIDLKQLEAAPRALTIAAHTFQSHREPAAFEVHLTADDWTQGFATLRGLPPGPIALRATDQNLTLFGTARTTLIANATNRVTLEPDNPELNIDLVDTNGTPMPNIYIFASPTGEPGIDAFYGKTDSTGRAAIGQVPFNRAHVKIMHVDLGVFSEPALEVPADGSPVLIRFDLPKRFIFKATDHGIPLPGLIVQSFMTSDQSKVLRLPVDANGLYDAGPSSPINFDITPESPWVWPQTQTIAASDPNEAPPTIEFRRKGDLIIRLRDAAGQPLAGAPITIHSTEFNTTVATWLAQSLIQTGPTGLVTDAAGEVQITGLPNGPFTWSAPSQGISGTATVPPFDTTIATGQLDE